MSRFGNDYDRRAESVARGNAMATPADDSVNVSDREPEHGRLTENATAPKPRGYDAVNELLQAYWVLLGLSPPPAAATDCIQDAIDAIALDVGRREVASWFDPRDMAGTRLEPYRAAAGRTVTGGR